MILNLKELNRFIVYHQFKMDNIESCIHLMKPMCFMAAIDLSDTFFFFSAPVDPSHQTYLNFFYGKGDSISSLVLHKDFYVPPGYSPLKLLKPVFSHLRLKGQVSCGYLDYSFLEGNSHEACLCNVKDTLSLLGDLGFCPNLYKSVVQPTHVPEYLGFILNSLDTSVIVLLIITSKSS